jgi:beta-galactosidase
VITPTVPHILYGGDYNPEQWPEEVWSQDVRLMREAGVNLVTVGVFSWARFEPTPGAFDCGWLDRVLDLLHAHGIAVNLATATAAPPPWLARLHPASLPRTREGATLWTGARQAYCPSSSAYRSAAAALVRRLAERYHAHPALAMWHVNNEYGCHVPACYCDASAAAFRRWLRARYRTLDALNAAWGTAFWSQRYANWNEVQPPRLAPTFVNPTQQLDFARFSSDALLDLFEAERAILRELTPEVPIVTNFMGFFKPLDYWKWAAREDLVADDTYPDPADPEAALLTAARCDLMRSLSGARPWMVMEQAPGAVNWRARNAPRRPGQLRLFALQAVARGAEGVLSFQWRASRAGAEKFHSGMLPHAGTDSRTWREVVQLGADLRRLDAVRGARVPAAIAIALDWESWWGLELDAHPSEDVRLLEQLASYYRPLYAHNLAADFVRPDADLDRYRLLLVPNLYLVRPGVAEHLARFVAEGGTLVMSFFSGIVDTDDHVPPGAYPAAFRALLGLRIEEFAPCALGQRNHILTDDGERHACDLWSDVLHLEGAVALATYEGDYYAGRPAVTRHAFGRGRAYYLGTRPAPEYMERLLLRACAEAGLAPPPGPPGVELVRRERDGAAFTFALNHAGGKVELPLDAPARDLLTGMEHQDSIRLAPLGVAVLAPVVRRVGDG